MQDRDAEVGNEYAPGPAQVTAARAVEDDATENPGPQTVTKRSQHAPDQLGQDDRLQREGQVTSLHDEQRDQGVAAALERSEAKPDGRSQDDAVTGGERVEAPGHENHRCALHELLDESDLEVPNQTGTKHKQEFEQRSGEHANRRGDDEGGQDAPWRQDRTGIVV